MTHILTIHNYSTRAIELIAEFVLSLYQSYMFSRKVKQTIDELSALTNKELNDIGLTRGEIYSIAIQEANRTEFGVQPNKDARDAV